MSPFVDKLAEDGDDSNGLLLVLGITDILLFKNGQGNHAPSNKQLIRCFFKNS
jgi:hypothetical protein